MLRLPSLAIVAVVSIVPTVRAQWHPGVGRCLGVGWGDGYHSHTACPPKGHILHHPHPGSAQAPVPWWKIPAAEGPRQAEPLPIPASSDPTGAPSSPPAGPSLFRQPGEGSSVSTSTTSDPAVSR
jgi:hypothetical protein